MLGQVTSGIDDDLESQAFCRVAPGVDNDLEAKANEILRQGRAGVTKLSEKKFYFTEDQLQLRQDREVLNSNGFPDPHIVRGLYNRAYNPTAGRRPSKRREEY